jgi:hypothetical protein
VSELLEGSWTSRMEAGSQDFLIRFFLLFWILPKLLSFEKPAF